MQLLSEINKLNKVIQELGVESKTLRAESKTLKL